VQNISQYDSGERCGPWASCYVESLVFSSFLAAFSGSFHALQSEWPVYYGGIGLQFSFYDRRSWIRHTGQNESFDATFEPHPASMCWIYLYFNLFLYVPSFHEDEITVSHVH
jgi:hypothetical protein